MYPTAAGSQLPPILAGATDPAYWRPTAPTPPAPRGHPAAPDAGPRGRVGLGMGRPRRPRPRPRPAQLTFSAQLCAALHHPRRNNSGPLAAALACGARAREGPSSALARARLGHGDGRKVEGVPRTRKRDEERAGGMLSCGRRAWKRCLFPPPRTRAGVPGLPNTSLRLLNCRSQLGLNTRPRKEREGP